MIFLIFCFFNIVSFCYASNLEEVFLQANVFYEQKEYQQALKLYEKIEPKSGVVFYNMGNCNYRLGDYVSALVCWRKAQKRGCSREEIEHNCQKAWDKLNVDISKKTTLHDVGIRFAELCSMGFWQFLFLVSWYILLFGLCWFPFLRKKLFLSMLLLLQCVIGSGVIFKADVDSQDLGIIKNSEVVLHAGTDERFNKRGSVIKGQEVVIQQKQGSWYKVSHNNQSGWLKADNLECVSC